MPHLQLYAQPFLAAVDYKNFKRQLSDGGYEPVDASVYDEAVERPDFNWNSFNSNVVLRWEYRPGSTLFLVWTQAREYFDDLGTFDVRQDMDYLFDTVPGNTFLVKASYRIGIWPRPATHGRIAEESFGAAPCCHLDQLTRGRLKRFICSSP